MSVLMIRDINLLEDYQVWFTLPYILLVIHWMNLGLGVYMGFKLPPTEVMFRNNKHFLINSSHDLHQFRSHESGESLFDLSQPSDFVLSGEMLPKYKPLNLWKVKVLSTEIVLLFISVDLAFYGLYQVLAIYFK